ncbi:MAG: hypothetical protein KAS29_05785, partial [Bacteroidales bacterium]|nr:hypothetical protein [Bacteroidales bacterium]
NNKYLDLIPTNYYLNESGELKEYPYFGRTDTEKQLKEFKKLFPEHREFGMATIDKVMNKLPDATQLLLKANYQMTSYIENRGNGEFSVKELPAEVQLAPVFAILTGDFTNDQLPDILITGNDFGNEIATGRYDALNGLLLRGDGKGNFEPMPMQQSGIIIPGDGKSLAKLQSSDSALLVISGQNRGKLGLFKSECTYSSIALDPFDQAAIVHLKDQRSYREEIHYGNSYLSHSGRRLWLPQNVMYVEIINYQGVKRTLSLSE